MVKPHRQGFIGHTINAANAAYNVYKGYQTANGAYKMANKIAKTLTGKKRKYQSSYGKTKRRGAKTKAADPQMQGQVASKAAHKLVLHKRPKALKLEGKWIYNHQFSEVLDDQVTGVQHVWSPLNILTSQQIFKTPPITSSTVTTNQWAQSAFGMDPNQKTTGADATDAVFSSAVTLGDIGSTSNCSGEVYVPHIHGEISFINLQNVGTDVKVYWLVNNQHCETDCKTKWAEYTTEQTMGQAAGAQKATLGVASTVGYPSFWTYGMSPFRYAEWNKIHKVKQVDSFFLGAGETKKLTFDIVVNYLIKYQKIADLTNNNGIPYIKGLTVQMLLVAKGNLVYVNESSGDKVTPGPVKLGFSGFYNVTFRGRPLSEKLPKLFQRTDAQLYSSTTAANISMIDQDGELETYEETVD